MQPIRRAAAVFFVMLLMLIPLAMRQKKRVFFMQTPYLPAALRDASAKVYAMRWAECVSDYPPAVRLLLAHDHLIRRCTYDADAADCHSAYGTIINRRAVCDGYAAAFALLAGAAGIRCMIVQGTANGIPHAWNLAMLCGTWYHIDCTWDTPSSETASPEHVWFLLSDAEMCRTHSWDTESYPAAAGGRYSYAAAVREAAALFPAADCPTVGFSAGEKDTESENG